MGAIIILTQIAQANTKTLTLRNLESDMHYQLKENLIYLEKLTDEEGFLDYYDRKVTLDYLFGDKEHYDEKGIGVFTNLNPDIALKITGITSKKKDIESDIVGFQLGYKDTDGFMLFDSYSSYLMTANYYSNKYKAIETEDYLINLSTQIGRIIDISENTFADVYLTAGAGFYYFGKGQDMNTEIKKDSGFMGNIGLGMTYNMSFYDFKSYFFIIKNFVRFVQILDCQHFIQCFTVVAGKQAKIHILNMCRQKVVIFFKRFLKIFFSNIFFNLFNLFI